MKTSNRLSNSRSLFARPVSRSLPRHVCIFTDSKPFSSGTYREDGNCMRKLLLSISMISLVIVSLPELKVSAQGTGTLTGVLSYPSDYDFPRMIVCAEAVNSKRIHCTDKRVPQRRRHRVGYKLTVPAGSYYVFATIVNGEEPVESMRGYKAYYSEFVKCGLTVKCTSHEPVIVTLRAGQTLAGIDPGDWYVDD